MVRAARPALRVNCPPSCSTISTAREAWDIIERRDTRTRIAFGIAAGMVIAMKRTTRLRRVPGGSVLRRVRLRAARQGQPMSRAAPGEGSVGGLRSRRQPHAPARRGCSARRACRDAVYPWTE